MIGPMILDHIRQSVEASYDCVLFPVRIEHGELIVSSKLRGEAVELVSVEVGDGCVIVRGPSVRSQIFYMNDPVFPENVCNRVKHMLDKWKEWSDADYESDFS